MLGTGLGLAFGRFGGKVRAEASSCENVPFPGYEVGVSVKWHRHQVYSD